MTFTQKFRKTIVDSYEWLKQIDTKTARTPISPDKWSPIEIIGHLLDSANNNHRRFTLAQWKEDMIFQGYEQEKWVQAQNYRSANWFQLLELWKLYNLHICEIMEHTPPNRLKKKHNQHNLDKIAMRPVPKEESVTLVYFMEDYIFHLQHHLNQISTFIHPGDKVSSETGT